VFTCSKCKDEFDEDQRATGYAQCRDCRAQYLKEWREKNPGRNAELCRARAARDPERVKREQAAYRADPANQEKARQVAKAWYRENRERALQWAKDNLDRQRPLKNARHKARLAEDPVYVAYCQRHGRVMRAKRRCAENSPLAAHFEAETKAFYFNCPFGMEVDHIHPVVSKRAGVHVASGLHVPWNLQYLPMVENRSKSCKLIEEV
jgi:DNA-directed RNA polymerase subunit RPC12/RpoP